MGNTFHGGTHHHHHYYGGHGGQPPPPPQVVDTRSVWRQHPIVGTLTYAVGAGIALALIINFWFIVLPLVIVGVGGYVGVKRWRGKRARTAALKARAQAEHEAYLRGEAHGTYGQYQPPTL